MTTMTAPLGHAPTALLTLSEAATDLRCSKRNVYELINRGELHSVKVGRLHRIARADLNAYVDGLRRGTSTGRSITVKAS